VGRARAQAACVLRWTKALESREVSTDYTAASCVHPYVLQWSGKCLQCLEEPLSPSVKRLEELARRVEEREENDD
jgi:hypothetical protein